MVTDPADSLSTGFPFRAVLTSSAIANFPGERCRCNVSTQVFGKKVEASPHGSAWERGWRKSRRAEGELGEISAREQPGAVATSLPRGFRRCKWLGEMERAKGFEPSTLTLAT